MYFRSISAPNSIKPLKITGQGLKSILTHHNVGCQFLDLLFSFATGLKESEAGPGSMTTKNMSSGACGGSFNSSMISCSNPEIRITISIQLCRGSGRKLNKLLGNTTNWSVPPFLSKWSGKCLDLPTSQT